MTPPTSLFGKAVLPPTDRNTQLPLGSERGDDLYALWKNVFDRARAVQHGAEPSGPTTPERGAERGAGAASVMPSKLPSLAARAQVPLPVQRFVSADATVSALAAAPTPMTSVRGLAAVASVALPDAGAAANRRAEPEPLIELGRVAPTQFTTAQASAGSPDSVSVYVQGAAVSIVVRDATLSEQEALRCGFETARRLTGQRASLAHLTLNGRVAYRQPGASDEPVSALIFAC